MSEIDTIILLSSNSRKEYIIDSLETIALPEGFIQHYRYSNKWVDSSVLNKLRNEEGGLTNDLLNIEMIICMLYRKIIDNDDTWEKIIPIRKAKLKSAYGTGENNDSVSHFHFELGKLVCPKDSFEKYINRKYVSNKNFVKLTTFNNNCLEIQNEESNIFFKLCNIVSNQGFYDIYGNKYEIPLFLNIEAVKDTNETKLAPEYNKLTRKGYFKLYEGSHYAIQFCSFTDSKGKTLNKDSFEIKIETDSKFFSTPQESIININAKYDLSFCDLMPSSLDKNIRSTVKITVIKITKKDESACLNYQLPIFVLLKKKFLKAFFDLLGDFCGILIPLILVLAKLFEGKEWPKWIYFSWEQLFIGTVVAWLVFKSIAKFKWN